MKRRTWHGLLCILLLVNCEAAAPTAPPPSPPPPTDGVAAPSRAASAQPASASAAASAAPAPSARFPAGWPYPERISLARGASMVSSDAALASKVGADILASGGNAVDAA